MDLLDITFEDIRNTTHRYYTDFLTLYLNSFPEAERREVSKVATILEQEETPFQIDAIRMRDRFVGFISHWKLSTYRYLEHFAIHPDMRSFGIGGRAMSAFIDHHGADPLLLEVEPMEDDLTTRRVRFYEGLGYKLRETPYIQPAYRTGGEQVPLLLMTHRFDAEPSEQELSELRHVVYGVRE